jgi:hypothetical protein
MSYIKLKLALEKFSIRNDSVPWNHKKPFESSSVIVNNSCMISLKDMSENKKQKLLKVLRKNSFEVEEKSKVIVVKGI